jgi:predicted Zn-dependent protease
MKAKLLFAGLLIAFSIACNKSNDSNNSTFDPNSLHNRSVGGSANELLSAGKYKSLKVEVQYMAGFAPDATAINHLKNFLETQLSKPDGVTIVMKEIAGIANTALNADEVHTIEKANRTVFSMGTEMAVYILYTNGNYSDNNVLGIAYRNTSAAIFGKKVRDNSGGIGQASRLKLEATVLEHEVGHLVGLVDIGSPMQSAHKANGSHCSNQACLMYYASETTDVLGFLITGNIPSLDVACINDLKANGGK